MAWLILDLTDLRSREKLHSERSGLDVKPLLLDVTKDNSVRSARDVIENAEGRLDVLVNNAGELNGCHSQTPWLTSSSHIPWVL